MGIWRIRWIRHTVLTICDVRQPKVCALLYSGASDVKFCIDFEAADISCAAEVDGVGFQKREAFRTLGRGGTGA